ncbi:TPM domain-containing protein [Qipengyuania sp. DSG2-2]|uniref:TPM domain-containing protein n=1 Tax=Qipengyuania sp. DGS2-2 TaxID=3349631 RepID=UPI0036D311A7
MSAVLRQLTIWAALFAAILATPLSAQEFPELTGRVVDAANIIPDGEEAALVQRLEQLEAQSQRQLVVATVPSLQDYDIADYGYRLGREWELGDAERNDGAILLVAPNERKVRIEVGYGLEGIMTDALSSIIIQNDILPRFRDNDYPGGILAGTQAIATQLELPADQAVQVAREAGEARESEGGFPIGSIIWLGFMFFFFILPMFGKGRRYRSGRGVVGDIILWEAGKAIARGASGGGSSWGGGGFGGGGFGGGFSGGGGSFGGGGASGGW